MAEMCWRCEDEFGSAVVVGVGDCIAIKSTAQKRHMVLVRDRRDVESLRDKLSAWLDAQNNSAE